MRLRGRLPSLGPVRLLLLSAAIIASLMIVAPVAQAAYIKNNNGEIYLSDYFGEANQLTVTDEDGDLVFRDAAAPITIQEANCAVTEGSDGHEVRCAGEGSSASSPEAWLGGGDDRVRWESAARPYLLGEDGNDELDASASRADGAALRGGEGDDRLIGADRPDDEGDGRVGDGLEGGPGADVLEDTDGTNQLVGDEGDDFITGGFGEDSLVGADGDDRLVGRGQRDVLFCGEGTDRHNAVFDEWKSRQMQLPTATMNHTVPASGECERGAPDEGSWRERWSETEVRVTERRYLWYTAALGQSNDVSVVQQGEDLLLTDAGARIRAAHGCTAVAESEGHQVRCTGAARMLLVDLDLGDGDDQATVTRPQRADLDVPSDDEQRRELGTDQGLTQARVHGGPGADTASGTSGLMWFRGGLGGDRATGSGDVSIRLQGGPDDDHLVSGDTTKAVRIEGDEGHDELVGTDRAENEIEGGPGRDRLTGSHPPYRRLATDGSDPSPWDYLNGGADDDVIEAGHGQGGLNGGDGDDLVRVGLGYHLVEGEGGNDRLLAAESATPDVKDFTYIWGGPGDDLISGGAGSDTLLGQDGADQVEGGSGHENLIGGDGSDRLFGDAGYDFLDGGASDDHYSCGSEYDNVVSDPTDFIASDCEYDQTLARELNPWNVEGLVSASGVASVPMVCRRAAGRPACRAELKLVRQGTTAGRSPVYVQPGQRRVIKVQLSAAAQRAVRRNRVVRATAELSARSSRGVRRSSAPLRLRAR